MYFARSNGKTEDAILVFGSNEEYLKSVESPEESLTSEVTISKDGKEVDAKRILGVMGLGVKKDQEIVLRADGDDEDAAIEKLIAFLQKNL